MPPQVQVTISEDATSLEGNRLPRVKVSVMFETDGRPMVITSRRPRPVTLEFVSRGDQLTMANKVCKRTLGISLDQFATLKAKGALAFDGPCHTELVAVEQLIPADWLQRVSGQTADSGAASAPSTQTTGEG